MTRVTLDSRLDSVSGESKKLAKAFGFRTVGDLLRHYPRSYVRKGDVSDLGSLQEGDLVAFVARVVGAQTHSYTDRRSGRPAFRTEVEVEAEGGRLMLTFFDRQERVAKWRADKYAVGVTGFCQGKVGRFRNKWQLAHPEFEPLPDDRSVSDLPGEDLDDLPDLRPIYRLAGKVTNGEIARAVQFALVVAEASSYDVLPPAIRDELGLIDFQQALHWIHRSDDWPQQRAAHQRLAFDEAFVTQVLLAQRRLRYDESPATPRTGGGPLLERFDGRLPFTLTAGQQEVSAQILADLARPHPMHRLLQGEVGSGKTVVALRAMLRVVDSGGQAVLLAPTEVLAQQHHRSITTLLGDLAQGGLLGGDPDGTRVALLTGSLSASARKQALLDAASGAAGIMIGTHALIEDRVQLADLGLVVVDEQHRFGVEQRAALTDKAATTPHVLVMTATPIPRTVAMTVFGDLETSTLTELPAGRQQVQTTIISLADNAPWLDRAWERIREEVAQGRQAYVVCPRVRPGINDPGLVDPGEDDDEEPLQPPAAVEDIAPQLASGPLQGLRVEMLHGQMPADRKDEVMRAFAAGEIDVLVATTVIEVGVDVPNATVMVVLDADRFGISQLHQLRGRIGRGEHPGLCLLVAQRLHGPAVRRLDAVAATTDGFELSRADLELRREGDVLGVAQSGGRRSLRLLRVLRDEDLIVRAREVASPLVAADPQLTGHPALAAAVRALEEAELADFVEKT